MGVRGEHARTLCRTLISAIEDVVPPDVTIIVRGMGKSCFLTAKGAAEEPYTLTPGDPGHAEFVKGFRANPAGDIHLAPARPRSGVWATWGFGPWVPFLPRRFAAKLAMIDALESIQEAVAGAHRKPWPGDTYQVRAEARGDTVRLWFEDSNGAVVPVGTFNLALATA